MDENVKNKQISDEELENVGGGSIYYTTETYMNDFIMKDWPAKEEKEKININLFDAEKQYGKKLYVTDICEICGKEFSTVLEDRPKWQRRCTECYSFVKV